jgi:hypothetical protein
MREEEAIARGFREWARSPALERFWRSLAVRRGLFDTAGVAFRVRGQGIDRFKLQKIRILSLGVRRCRAL